MADEKKSEAIFGELHRALAERGLYGQQRQLGQYRDAVVEESAEVVAALETEYVKLREELVAKYVPPPPAAPSTPEAPPPPAVQP